MHYILPIVGSMYGIYIYTYIWLSFLVNVGNIFVYLICVGPEICGRPESTNC